LTSRYCDYGTALAVSGTTERAAEHRHEAIEHKLDRLRRKGWSRNRIERWLVQVEADHDAGQSTGRFIFLRKAA